MRIIGLIPCLIFLACHCHCLLRNCVSEEDWENDTSGSPRCEVVTPQKVEVECYGTKTETEISVNRISSYQQTENNTPVIICNASYPIDVDEDGFKLKGVPKIFTFRRMKPNTTNQTEKLFTIVVPLFTSIWTPRWFTFRSIENPNIRTRFYFYYPGSNDRSLPFDWPNQKMIPTVVEPEERYAILPCQVTHRSDKIELKKNKCSTGEDLSLKIDNKTIRFTPKDGFIIDTLEYKGVTNDESVYGVYTCLAQNKRKSKSDLETLQVTLRRPKRVSFEPKQSRLFYFSGEIMKLRCKSSSPLTLSGTLNGKRIPSKNFTITYNDNVRSSYDGKFEISLTGTDYGRVSCMTEVEGLPKQTWTFQTLDLRKNEHLQFVNNGTGVKCSSSVSAYLTIFNAGCYNDAHCRSRRGSIETFGAGQCDLRLTKIVRCGYSCEKSPGPDECLDVARSERSGIYKCETEDLAKKILYLIGYDGKIYTNFNSLRSIPRNAIIRVRSLSETVYTDSKHTFLCEASSFISNGEFHWKLRRNGTEFLPTIQKVEEFHDFVTANDSIWQATMSFSEPMKGLEVQCHVPIWNTRNDWLVNSVFIDVVRPTPPKIDETEPTTQTYYIGENNKFLRCTAYGNPLPEVQWLIDGKPVNRNMTENGGVNLVFNHVEEAIEGTYRCEASNSGGTVSRDYHVSVASKPNLTLYIIISLIFLGGLIAGLIFLYWKLMKAKKRIRNLTDEEVNEFLHGNEEAAKAAKEPHEAIMHLPFNSEYEILQDHLEFDENDVLGSGAYGIVFRGRLVGYPDEVAIKTTKPHSTLSYFKALLSELKIMVYLGKHENVIHLIGAYTGKIKERVLYMVVELSPYGSLEDYLRKQQKTFCDQIENDKIRVTKGSLTRVYANFTPDTLDNPGYVSILCTTDLVSMSHQIAEGMHHLATKKVIHADLAARNVLLYNRGVVKITDFGLSRQLYAYTSYMKKEQEPLPWRSMAIESLREMNFSTQSDVWAYGVTLWEIFSLGGVPYPGLSWSIDFVDQLAQGLRLSKPPYATNKLYEIMLQTWHTDPAHRPSFDELRNFFREMRASLEKLSE